MKMKFPKFLLNKQVQVYSTTLGEDGEEETLIYDGMCIYDEKSKQTLNAERQLVTLSGSIVIEGDIFPNKLITGYVSIDGIKRNIYGTERPRVGKNGVFITKLDLI
jgi:hypothetical protein